MNHRHHATPAPAYAAPPMVARLSALFAAVLISTGVLGGMLGLFEGQARDATLARAAVPAGAAKHVASATDTPPAPRAPVVARADL